MFKYSNKFLFWSPSNIRCNSQQNITFKWTLTFQRNCIEFALNAKPVRRYIPKNPLQYKLWAFATSPICEYTVFVAIMLNTLSLAMKFNDQPLVYTKVLDALNIIFTVFFTLEFVLKLGAFKFKVRQKLLQQKVSTSKWTKTKQFSKMDTILLLMMLSTKYQRKRMLSGIGIVLNIH